MITGIYVDVSLQPCESVVSATLVNVTAQLLELYSELIWLTRLYLVIYCTTTDHRYGCLIA